MATFSSTSFLVSKQMAQKIATSQYLPPDIVAEILSRLPVRYLFRFRCVCKLWNSLTYDPHFGSKHLYRAPSNLIIFIPRTIDYNDIQLYDFLKDGTLTMHSSYNIRVKRQGEYLTSNIVHGLTCAYNCDYMDDYICLSNPFTREFAQLPSRNNSSRQNATFGFGYDVTTGKYKLVRLFFLDFAEDRNQHGEILTLGSKEWRYLGKAPCRATIAPAAYVAGVIYWKGYGLDVLSFDIKQEKFAIILGPPDARVDKPGLEFSSLHGSGGHLYLMFGHHRSLCFKICLLKDFATGLWIDIYDIYASSIEGSYWWNVTSFSIEDKKVQLVLSQFYRFRKWTNAILSYDTCSKTFLKLYEEEGGHPFVRFALCSDSLISPRKLIGNVL